MNNTARQIRSQFDAASVLERPKLRKFPTDQSDTHSIAVAAQGLYKTYQKNRIAVPVLKGVDFAAEQGKTTAIIGKSGSGKSTLLHLLATLDRPDAGEVHFEGRRIDNLSRSERDRFRNQQLGMIFQFYHLLPELSALENVLAPQMIGAGIWRYLSQRKNLQARACEILDLVGLSHRIHHKPNELSGGEMQRTAIARALVTRPRLLLADEPTGNLDQETGAGVLDIIEKVNRDEGLTVVMVTHDEAIAERCDRVVRLVQGRVESVD